MDNAPLTPNQLIQTLTPEKLEGFVRDFHRLMREAVALKAENKPLTKLLNAKQYGLVLGLLRDASRLDDPREYSFCLGLACAFHGLQRLEDALRLEQNLQPALEGAGNGAADAQTAVVADPASGANPPFAFADLRRLIGGWGLNYLTDEPNGVTMFGIQTEQGPVHVFICMPPGRNLVALSCKLPLTVPPAQRGALAEAITRVNYGLLQGCFELDLETGDLNFRTGLPTDAAVVTDEQLRHCVGFSLALIEEYLPAFQRMMARNVALEDARRE